MERYRSGRNGADSKSVCAQAHVGSNPTLSANIYVKPLYIRGFYFCVNSLLNERCIILRAVDLTNGSPAKKIIAFAIPIFIGNLFQQIYSISDTFVVGRYLGKDALAAVGACSAVMVFITSIIIGLCMGSGVYFSDLYGAREYKKLSSAISTSFIFILAVTGLIMLVTMGFMDQLMRFFNIPDAVMGLARVYLMITVSGLPFMLLYSMSTVILRAFGDSKTPLIFLVISSTVNIIFDFLLVLVWPLGVKGPALSTLAAQIFSGIPLAIYAVRKVKFVSLRPAFEKSVFSKVAKYSVMTSLQQSIMNFGILLVQRLVNSFGVTIMAAFAIGVKIDTFAYMPAQDFGNAFSTYVAQNKGAGKNQRIRRGFRSAILCSTVFSVVVSLIIYIFAPDLIAIFSDADADVIAQGARYLRIEGMFYTLIGYLFIHYGFYRGLGRFNTSIFLTIVSLGLRVALSYLFVGLGFGVASIWWSIVIGWATADFFGFYIYKRRISPVLHKEAALSSDSKVA